MRSRGGEEDRGGGVREGRMGSRGGEEVGGGKVREGKRSRRESSPCCDTSLRIVTAPTHWTGAPL